MNVLVTAGNTLALIDRVRGLTNVFTGRTGAAIAVHAHSRGHAVTLLTSRPEVVPELAAGRPGPDVQPYSTFEDLQSLMARHLRGGAFDAVVHCAAVSDYLCGGVYAPAPGTQFRPEDGAWAAAGGPRLADRAAGKVKSDEPELWLRLVRAPKLIDLVRADWGFTGTLVKFKLEVGVRDAQLLEVAERSRQRSGADLMVANTLEGAAEYAFLGPFDGAYRRVNRAELAEQLVDALERRRGHG